MNPHAPEFFRTTPREHLGRPGRKCDRTGRIKLNEQIRTAKGQRDKSIPLGPQVFGTLTAV